MSPACKLWYLIIMWGPKQTSPTNIIFLSITEAKAHWKVILTHCLKIECKKTRINDLLIVYRGKKQACSVMKQSISHMGVLCTSMAIGIKWCPKWNFLYLWILVMALNSVAAHVVWLMTVKATVSHVKSIATTLAMKT
jgi:hypothetical protein